MDISNEITLAQTARKTLVEKYGQRGQTSRWHLRCKYLNQLLIKGDWDPLHAYLIRTNMALLNAKVNDLGQTPLHVAVAKGHVHLVKKLVGLVTEEGLEMQDDSGMTAMALASALGDTQMLECMHQKNKKLLTLRDRTGRIPLLVALEAGNIEVAVYHYSVTPKLDLIRDALRHSDTSLITALILGNKLDLALDLLRCAKGIAILPDRNGHIPLYALACRPSAFPSGCQQLAFWKKWIYACITIDDLSAHATDELRTDNQRQNHSPNEVLININRQNEHPVRGRLHQLISNLLKLLGMTHIIIYNMKALHAQSRELLELTHQGIKSRIIYHKSFSDVMFRATREGVVEIVREMLKADPSLVERKDEKSRTIFSFAVLCRQATIWNLFCELPMKYRDQILLGPADCSRNNILHMAAMVDTSAQPVRNTSAAFQMQRELQWFKEVEEITPPSISEALNSENMRPKEIFTRDHKEILKQGEKWMKGTATSCMVVGTLIVTIMFAVAFAVPGGNNQATGLPMFSEDKLFLLFIISDALALSSSTTSVLIFLGILTLRYVEEDFLKSLPHKMIIGLLALFFSIATMMIAFCVALLIMLPGKPRMVIPIIFVACVPVVLFVFVQFPLLVDMIKSTYGRSIFVRK